MYYFLHERSLEVILMFLISHETDADVIESANLLMSLGVRCINIMIELVTEQELSKKSLSKSILILESNSFLKIIDTSTQWQKSFKITPTLLGEEALDLYLNDKESD